MESTRTTDGLEAARRALEEGENFRAYDLAERAAGESPEKLRVMALALARSGALDRARELAERLSDGEDSEIMGLKSRLYKDLALASRNPAERREWFAKAADTSEQVFRSQRRYYNGIVRQYNTKLQTFPSSLVASFNNLQKHEMFEAADDALRANVKVEF